MSALGDAVQARIATQRLVQLTNPNSPSATAVDTTYLELAVTDTVADFETYAQERYDPAEPRHVAAGVKGVLATMRTWKGMDDDDEKALGKWHDSLEAMAKTRSRARVIPASSRTATPSPEPSEGDGSKRPVFDRTRFRDLDVDPPPGGLGDLGRDTLP